MSWELEGGGGPRFNGTVSVWEEEIRGMW
jgi:hypothetical protein